jgi:cytokinesis protein
VNLQEVRKGLSELREGLKSIRLELQDHFADIESSDPNDLYGKKMWRFVGEASERLDDLVDEVTLADSSYGEVVRYYGEDDRNMTSIEFFGTFKTFVTSYKARISFHFICTELTWGCLEMQDGQPNLRRAEGRV